MTKDSRKDSRRNSKKDTKKEFKKELYCSFCGKSSRETLKLIAGPGVYICNECVSSCHDIILSENEYRLNKLKIDKIPTPTEIHQELNRYVISQEAAKKALSVAVYNHYKRVLYNLRPKKDVVIEKSNILMIGPTGTGKTLLAQTIAKFLDVPFAIVDATSLTEAGYVGDDVESILLRLIESADYDIERAEKGIIYIDEFDKLSRKSSGPTRTRDVSGEGVQQTLLKILEGSVVNISQYGSRGFYQDNIEIDTKDILFICGGAFDGLEEQINKRSKRTIGFNSTEPIKESLEIQPEDLIEYGIVPECLGRLPIIINLEQLTEKDLVQILTEPANALVKQYQLLFELDNTKLEFQKKALELIAQEAIERKAGARGLKSILEEVLLDIMFEIPSTDIERCVITPNVIKKKSKPLMYPKKKAI